MENNYYPQQQPVNYTQPQMQYAPQYPSPLLKQKDKLFIPELILGILAFLINTASLLSTVIYSIMQHHINFYMTVGLITTAIDGILLILFIVFIAVRKNAQKTATLILGIFAVIGFLSDIAYVIFYVVSGNPFRAYFMNIVSAVLILILAVVTIIAATVNNKALGIVLLIFSCLALLLAIASQLYTIIQYARLGLFEYMDAYNKLNYVFNIKAYLIYASQIILSIRIIKNPAKKKAPQPVYPQYPQYPQY